MAAALTEAQRDQVVESLKKGHAVQVAAAIAGCSRNAVFEAMRAFTRELDGRRLAAGRGAEPDKIEFGLRCYQARGEALDISIDRLLGAEKYEKVHDYIEKSQERDSTGLQDPEEERQTVLTWLNDPDRIAPEEGTDGEG